MCDYEKMGENNHRVKVVLDRVLTEVIHTVIVSKRFKLIHAIFLSYHE